MANETLLETLHKALDMEKKGYKFYAETEKNSQNDVIKKTFRFLANGEMLHIETIKKFYDTMVQKDKFPLFPTTASESKEGKDLDIFSKSISELKEKIKPVDDERKALEFAMEFENTGYRYYENMRKAAKDNNLIALLNFLLKEESKHYELLMNAHSYINDTQNWFMYEEGSFPQG